MRKVNIITWLDEQVKKGKNLVTKEGELITPQDFEKDCQNTYVKLLKDGHISFTTSFQEYQKRQLSTVAKVDDVRTRLLNILGGGENDQ